MFNKKPLIVALVAIATFMVGMVLISSFTNKEEEPTVRRKAKKSFRNIILIVADDLGIDL